MGLSQPVEDVARLLTSVEAEAGDEQMITVRWNAIQCASQYEVFQKINTVGGVWEKIGTSKENVFESKGAPCMEYKYGVKVTIDEQVSEVVEFNEAIMTKIDTSVPYVAANLAIHPTPDGAHLTWDHGKCIKSYKIRTCEFVGETEECFEEMVIIEDPSMYKMAHTLRKCPSVLTRRQTRWTSAGARSSVPKATVSTRLWATRAPRQHGTRRDCQSTWRALNRASPTATA